ncbi:hypothetical protein [Gordonia sp. VNK21]|uniref:hypothetical protein n=1 Tax=Gordonia sp. VNK21 TaxID=3382483 RepID=UPI0038D36ADC
MILQVANPIAYYPLETAGSYLRRLCATNHLDPVTTHAALHYQIRGRPPREQAQIATDRLETLAGLAPGTITRTDDAATAMQPQRRCYECDRNDRPRWQCLQCAQGQIVEQVRHHRHTICLRHRRWTGPGTPPLRHVRVDLPALITAEQHFRHQRLGLCPTNVIAARSVAARWALGAAPAIVAERRAQLPHITVLPEDIQTEIVTYPEAVGVMAIFADGAWLRDILAQTHAYAAILEAVTNKIQDFIPQHTEHPAALIMKELKPVIARYFHTHGPYRHYNDYEQNPPLPVWHHDIDLTLGGD